MKFLVDSKLVYDTLEGIIAKADYPECKFITCIYFSSYVCVVFYYHLESWFSQMHGNLFIRYLIFFILQRAIWWTDYFFKMQVTYGRLHMASCIFTIIRNTPGPHSMFWYETSIVPVELLEFMFFFHLGKTIWKEPRGSWDRYVIPLSECSLIIFVRCSVYILIRNIAINLCIIFHETITNTIIIIRVS